MAKKPKKLNISKAIKHPGALHRQLGVPKGKKIPKSKIAAAAKKGGKLGERARFAQTLAKIRPKKRKKQCPLKPHANAEPCKQLLMVGVRLVFPARLPRSFWAARRRSLRSAGRIGNN